MADYSKMSKSLLLKKYGPFIKENFGKEEFDYVKREDVDGVRRYIISLDPEPVKKRDGGVENVKKEIRSAVNMGNLMLSDLKKQGIIPKGAKVKGSEALKPGEAEKSVEGFIKSQKKKGKSKEEAIKKMLKQTKQLKKGLDVGYTKARKKAGLLPERNIPTVKKAMGGVMKNRGGTFKGTF